MKNTLILHGWGGNSNENWLPWLKNEVEFKADETFIPNLPSTQSPILEEQLEYLYVYSNDFKGGGNFIGHSLGCTLTLKFVIDNNIRNSNIVLVSPTYNGLALELGKEMLNEHYPVLEKYYDTEIDFKKLNKLGNKTTIFLSENDPYINLENAKKYYSKLENVDFKIFKDKGHFNQGAGVLELEEILEYLD